ncbi:MAG TPA: helix-hairpin-helix domain-containing protein, partial [Blastocatellia bacterium]
MINEEVANIFEKMSRLLAFKGADRFRILAYERAALALRDLDEDLAKIAAEGGLQEIPGIGHDLAAMIEEYIKTKRIRRYERERRRVPEELIELMNIPGLGPKTLALLHKKLRVDSFEDLKRAIDTEALLSLPGFGEKKIENLRRGMNLWLAGKQRMLISVALPLAENLLAEARKIKSVKRADVAGSIRRRRETIGDMDLLIISSDISRALSAFTRLPEVRQVIELGETRARVIAEGGIQVDIRAVERRSYGAALQYFTGSKQHNIHLRTLAHERGLKINEYGVF